MSLETAFSDTSGQPYSGQAGPYFEGYSSSVSALPAKMAVDPFLVIDDYRAMLSRIGAPIEYIKIPEVETPANAVKTAETREPAGLSNKMGAVACQVPVPKLPPDKKEKPKSAPPLAVYSTFNFPPLVPHEIGFVNVITVFDRAGRTQAAKKLSEAHEGTHSGQWAHSAALHAVPLNGKSPYVLSVRDWIKATLLTEAEAYAKTALVGWAMKHSEGDDTYEQETQTDPVTVRELEDRLAQGFSMEDALVSLAIEGMQKEYGTLKLIGGGVNTINFIDHYVGFALSQYNKNVRFDNPDVWKEFPYEFVRLETQDYEEMGTLFGPQIAGRLADKLDEFLVFDAETEDKVADLEQKLGIFRQNELRTLSEGIAALGLTSAQFIERSKQPYERDVTQCAYYSSFRPRTDVLAL